MPAFYRMETVFTFKDSLRILGQFGCAPGTEGTERAEFTTEERRERRDYEWVARLSSVEVFKATRRLK